jgi:hypothetical protein
MSNSADSMFDSRLQQLETDIRTHPGEFILIRQHAENRRPGSGGCFGAEYYYDREVQLTLGVLVPNTAQYELACARSLPTAKYVHNHRDSRVLTASEGAWNSGILGDQLALLLKLKINYHHPLDEAHVNEHAIDLVIGDEAVDQFFHTANRLEAFWFPERAPIWYQQAARLLERPLSHSPELDEDETRQRAQLLERLWELEAKLAPHRQRILGMTKASKSRDQVFASGGALSLIEGEDGLRIHSMADREKISSLEKSLSQTLASLEKLGAGDHPYVVAFKLRYKV